MRSKFACLAVGLCALATIVAGCAESNLNPVSTVDGDHGVVITTAVVNSSGQTVNVDTVSVGTNVISSADVVRASLLDSILMSTWRHGDGTFQNCAEAKDVCISVHKYNTPGTFIDSLTFTLINGVTRTVYKSLVVVNPSQLPVNLAREDSLFMYASRTQGSSYNRWNVTFFVGVNAINATALNAGVSLNLQTQGGSDSLWNLPTNQQLIPVTSKSSDGKFWVVTFANVKDSADYTVKLWLNTTRNIWWTEIDSNRFANATVQNFRYSLLMNGLAVPVTTNYGVRGAIPPDTTTHVSIFPSGTVGDSILKVSLNTTRDTTTFWFCGYKKIGSCSGATNARTNLPVPIQPVTMISDSVGYLKVANSAYPNGGITLYNYSLGTCIGKFQNSMFGIMADSSATFVNNSTGPLAKKAVK